MSRPERIWVAGGAAIIRGLCSKLLQKRHQRDSDPPKMVTSFEVADREKGIDGGFRPLTDVQRLFAEPDCEHSLRVQTTVSNQPSQWQDPARGKLAP
jgi:hypothetical protein